MAKITVVGSANIDLVVRTPRMPVKGETILGGPFFSGCGGKGANQAVGAARLGGDVTIVARLGQDQFGAMDGFGGVGKTKCRDHLLWPARPSTVAAQPQTQCALRGMPID